MRIILLIVYLSEFLRFGVSACFAYYKTVIKQRMVVKSAFEDQSEENSMWILKWTTLLGTFWKIRFTPTVTSYNQVHAGVHRCATLLCCLWCHWCRNIAAVSCVLHWTVLTLFTLQIGITLVIVVAQLCTENGVSFTCAVLWKLHG